MKNSTRDLNNRPLIGTTDTENPETVGTNRAQGYPYPPYTTHPDVYIQGASSIGKTLDGDPQPLMQWFANNAIQYAAKNREHLANLNQNEVTQQIKQHLQTVQENAPAFGNYFHDNSALYDNNRPIRQLPANADYTSEMVGQAFANWKDLKTEYGMQIKAVERTLYTTPTDGTDSLVAGTADRIVSFDNLPEYIDWATKDDLFIFDIKTKKTSVTRVDLRPSHAMQVLALSTCDRIAYEEYRDTLPYPDNKRPVGGVVAYVCPDGVKLYFIQRTPEIERVIEAAALLANFQKNFRATSIASPAVLHSRENPDYAEDCLVFEQQTK